MIVYEYPFNERVRSYLRLEYLLRRLDVLLQRNSDIDHHFAITTLFEIMDVASRSDLKTDVLKDLERQKNLLDVLRDNPDISQHLLHQVARQVEQCFKAINEQNGKTGQALTENDWLMSIRAALASLVAPAALICLPTMPGSISIHVIASVTWRTGQLS